MAAPRFLAAIATPFASDGALDLGAFAAHLAWLGEAGLDGVFVAGTTGEGVLLEDDEVAALVERAVAAAGGLRVIAQVGRPSTRATARLARRAIDLGADAVAACVPWFYPAGDAEARTHFLGLLEAAGDTPAFLYNIPRRTVNDLTPAMVAELAGAGFAGMKDSTGDFARHEAYLDALDGREFELYVGAEPLVLRAHRRGATGAITGLANCHPELFTALRDAIEAGDDAAADPGRDREGQGRGRVRGLDRRRDQAPRGRRAGRARHAVPAGPAGTVRLSSPAPRAARGASRAAARGRRPRRLRWRFAGELLRDREFSPDTVGNVREGNNSFEAALESALESLPLEHISLGGAGRHRDATVRLGGRPIKLALRWAGRGWPHEVEEAVRDVGEPWPVGLVLVARDFSAGALRLLRDRGANWADLGGQARIVVPDRLAVLREPPRRTESAPKPQVLRWSPSAVSTAEAVLTQDSPIRIAQLAELTGWSMPQVSKVLQAFDRRGWTRRTGPRRGPTASRETADREGMLAEWSQWLGEQQRPRRFAHTTRRDVLALVDDELAPALARRSWMLSGWAAAALLAPLATTVPTLQVYVSADDFRDLPGLLADTSLHPVDEGGRIEFWPADEHTLRLAQREGQVRVASRPRVYADLRRFGDRGADAADHLKAWWLEAPIRRGGSR